MQEAGKKFFNEKIQQTSECNIKEADSQVQRANQWLPVVGEGEGEGQNTGCKTGSRAYCTTQGTEPVFCSNCTWKVTFKNCIKINK